jgi:methyltransferase
MENVFWAILSFVIVQRVMELIIAKRNEKWIKSQGGIEAGAEHYKWIVMLHIGFFISLILEYSIQGLLIKWWAIPFMFFTFAQVLRGWSLLSLGRYWNTKILLIPNSEVVKKGPYKYIRHPNYLVVGLEIFMLPFMFSAYFTAVLFTLLNSYILLFIRIPAEEKALAEDTDYLKSFASKSRFYPRAD